MDFEDDIQADINKELELEKRTDPLEKLKQKLREKQENIYEDPNKVYVEIDIPKTGKIGKECKVKFNKKVPNAQIAVSQDMQWKRRDKFDRTAKPELVCKAFKIGEKKDTDSISFIWEDVGKLHGEDTNFLQEGEYMVEVRAWSTVAGEETTSRRLVIITK